MLAKRIFDIFFSLSAIIFGFPVFLACSIAIKCSSPGPIFYSCTRVGRNGKPFACWKFRTMYIEAETRLKELLANNTTLMQEWKVFFKLKNDPRITPIGKWLRKVSLDELPQFWNILKGDMSVVGPRPLTTKEITDYLKEKASTILSVKPGLTCLWATRGRNHLTLRQRILLEEFYVHHRSFWLDLRLVVQTALMMLFSSKGAF